MAGKLQWFWPLEVSGATNMVLRLEILGTLGIYYKNKLQYTINSYKQAFANTHSYFCINISLIFHYICSISRVYMGFDKWLCLQIG